MNADPVAHQPRVLIWDLSIRVLHLAFAGGITLALVIGFAFGEHSPLFPYHMLAGLFAGGALVVRLVLGVVGPRHARFGDWPLGPAALIRFARGFLPGAERPVFAGHNPAAAWTMLGMFAALVALIATGLNGGEDLHEGLAWVMVALIGAHLAGIALHSWLHRENLPLAMVDGRKRAPAAVGLNGHGWLRGAAVGLVLGAWAAVLLTGYDPTAGTLTLPGVSRSITLGEGGEARSGEGKKIRGYDHKARGHEHDDHDDD